MRPSPVAAVGCANASRPAQAVLARAHLLNGGRGGRGAALRRVRAVPGRAGRCIPGSERHLQATRGRLPRPPGTLPGDCTGPP